MSSPLPRSSHPHVHSLALTLLPLPLLRADPSRSFPYVPCCSFTINFFSSHPHVHFHAHLSRSYQLLYLPHPFPTLHFTLTLSFIPILPSFPSFSLHSPLPQSHTFTPFHPASLPLPFPLQNRSAHPPSIPFIPPSFTSPMSLPPFSPLRPCPASTLLMEREEPIRGILQGALGECQTARSK